MSYENIKHLSPEKFKRLCGIKPDTFRRICDFISEELKRTQKKSGRPTFLSIEDQVLLTLEYWREYRTQFHIANSWNLSEPTVCRIIRKIEDILKRCDDFKLPGKKVLQTSENVFEVIVVDATETVIERPKKNNEVTIRARSGGIR
jgi:hypothetical protein